jgi:archaemetzincin
MSDTRVRPGEKSATSGLPIGELVIVPFEGFPAQIAQALAGELAARGISTRVDAPVPLPDAAYAPTRGQYRGEPLLVLVSGHGARHVLGITERDLFSRDLNFIFGIASPGGACVVSTARLVIGADDRLFWARLLKEVVHELGHTLGLAHCADPGCVMHFSNSLADTDRKGDACCERCSVRLRARRRR